MSADAMAPDAVRGQRPVAAIVSSRFLGGCGTFVCVGLAGVAALAGDMRMAGREVPIVFTQVPAEGRGTPAEWRADGVLRGDGFEGARLVGMRAGGVTQELSTGFHSACDPEVSPDGRKLAFAAKRGPGSNWGIWERDLESGEVREVVGGEWDRRGPRYLGSLFTLDSPEPWSTLLFTSVDGTANEPGHGAATSLYSVKLDGTEARRLTFEPSASFDPVQLWDGRVIYAVWRYPSAGFGHPPPLFTDGRVHDVGTRQWNDRTGKFDVPHLNNIYDSAPYLHNGMAPTLEEIWTRYNPYDQHGVANDMTKDQLNELVEYLKTL